MKRKYIVPNIYICDVACTIGLLAGSDGSGGGEGVNGEPGSENVVTKPIKPGSGGGLTQHSKAFSVWDTWDED